jgi:hypothetical protein
VRQLSNRLQSIWSKNILEYKFCTCTGTLKSSNQNTGFIGYDLLKGCFSSMTRHIYISILYDYIYFFFWQVSKSVRFYNKNDVTKAVRLNRQDVCIILRIFVTWPVIIIHAFKKSYPRQRLICTNVFHYIVKYILMLIL